ncbi:hypothetical protein H4R34_006483 [Dimargaris verticillata]|uniref:Uncharacterized protein n=1 Tax=Dimargaris verticillata TaxID=2761393 RepID=A0A9W8AQ88_9FUNG|nr:hypothetical protein H4R34_006483 [Dimargaris verticillata]
MFKSVIAVVCTLALASSALATLPVHQAQNIQRRGAIVNAAKAGIGGAFLASAAGKSKSTGAALGIAGTALYKAVRR